MCYRQCQIPGQRGAGWSEGSEYTCTKPKIFNDVSTHGQRESRREDKVRHNYGQDKTFEIPARYVYGGKGAVAMAVAVLVVTGC